MGSVKLIFNSDSITNFHVLYIIDSSVFSADFISIIHIFVKAGCGVRLGFAALLCHSLVVLTWEDCITFFKVSVFSSVKWHYCISSKRGQEEYIRYYKQTWVCVCVHSLNCVWLFVTPWTIWTVVMEKTLESPLDCKEIPPIHPKGDQSWVFIWGTDVEAETPILWPPDAKRWLT